MGNASIIKAQIIGRSDDYYNLQMGSAVIKAPFRKLNQDEKKVNIAVRPFDVYVSRNEEENSLPGRIKRRTYLGSFMNYIITTEVGVFDVVTPEYSQIEQTKGDEVFLSLNQDKIAIIG